MSALYLSRLHFPVTTLGPGQRIGIWFQGCSLGCKGCISRDTWNRDEQTRTTIPQVMRALRPWLSTAQGVTISGGEPFEQPEALFALLKEIRSNWDGDVLVYSGLELDNVQELLTSNPGMIDALITGRYVESADQTLPLRGSDNQPLHMLTSLGQERFHQFVDAQASASCKAIDLMQGPNGELWMAGIPSREDWKQLAALIEQQGHRAQTSADTTATGRNHHS